MMDSNYILNSELNAERAFSSQAQEFDALYGNEPMIHYKRQRVRSHVEQFLQPNSQILELNAGTGDDTLYFLQHGHKVHATDISGKMLEQLRSKSDFYLNNEKLTIEEISFNSIDQLQDHEKFDYVFSNFAGLNCTGDLKDVLNKLPALLKPGGVITLVILPGFCLWEFLLLFKGKFKTAFRRLFAMKGAFAKVNNMPFRCWYYNPSYVINSLRQSCEVLSVEGLCTFVPPSYLKNMDQKYPTLFKWLGKMEQLYKTKWPWKNMGDYYIISFRKRTIPHVNA